MKARRSMKRKKCEMKARRSMKRKKRVSKIARGRLRKSLVLRGLREKTSGGLRAEDLMRNKRGKIVSKRLSEMGKRHFVHIEGWIRSVMAARGALRITGFMAINGQSIQGKLLYVKAKALRGDYERQRVKDETAE